MDSAVKWKVRAIADRLPDNKGSEWVDDGNCANEDVSEFVYSSPRPTRSQRHKLQKICEGCPVKSTCLYEAIRNQEVGWWGGMDQEERTLWAFNNLRHML